MGKNKQLVALGECGQSIWYDNLSFDVLRSGKLQNYIDLGVTGLTSNPTIFKKAIADTCDYDERIVAFAADGIETEQLCEKLMIEDVARAADLLLPLYNSTSAHDGYASIEVSPLLARDTQQTIESAKSIWAALDRPNIMIKIPATKEGLPAIEEVIAEGINVNVTLIFSVKRYKEVIQAFLKGLTRRMDAGQSVSKIASVASFFVSRVDAIVEKELASLSISEDAQKEFVGHVGIANSKAAYELYQQMFEGESFTRLCEAGAQKQRPLWASTSTKNPAFPPLLYVESLVGDNTVNTIPPATLDALLEGGSITSTISTNLDQAKKALANLVDVGVPFEELLVKLEEDGVDSFCTSYEELLAAIEQKRAALTDS